MIDKACSIALETKNKTKGKKLVDFEATVHSDPEIKDKIAALQNQVNEFAMAFPMPGFDDH